MDGFIRRQVLIVWIRNLNRTVLYTDPTTGAVVFYNVSWLFCESDLEVSCLSCYTVNFCICQNLDIGVPADLDQFGGENSHGTVIGWIGLVKLGHLAANRR
jgi:hypothetical protein